MELLGVIGSTTPPGRLAGAVAGALERARLAGHAASPLDLGALSLSFADGRPLDELGDDSAAAVARLAAAEAVLLATPIYRASMTGSLKNFPDLAPVDALRGKPCAIVSMGATAHHYLGAESHLRDVLAWFGALVAPVAVYLQGTDFADGRPTEAAAAQLDELVVTLARMAAAFPRGATPPGPAPFAARRA